MPGKKHYVSVSKGMDEQKLCNLQELYDAFKEKQPNVYIGFSKFCALRLKWCVLVGSKMTHSVCICSAYQNVVCNGLRLDIDSPGQIIFVLL